MVSKKAAQADAVISSIKELVCGGNDRAENNCYNKLCEIGFLDTQFWVAVDTDDNSDTLITFIREFTDYVVDNFGDAASLSDFDFDVNTYLNRFIASSEYVPNSYEKLSDMVTKYFENTVSWVQSEEYLTERYDVSNMPDDLLKSEVAKVARQMYEYADKHNCDESIIFAETSGFLDQCISTTVDYCVELKNVGYGWCVNTDYDGEDDVITGVFSVEEEEVQLEFNAGNFKQWFPQIDEYCVHADLMYVSIQANICYGVAKDDILEEIEKSCDDR